MLADAAGLSRRDARGQVKTARVIEAAPSVRDAVESGRVSLANAERLAEAVTKTSAGAVDSDADLLSKAETMRPEDFTREARRWATARQVDSGESEYQRQRARRCVRVWDADDGMVELHGKFDPVTGRRIGNRLQAEARRLYEVDKKNAKDAGGRGHSRSNRDAGTGADTGNGSGLDGNKPTARRSFDQCMADALDAITSTANSGGVNPFADITVVAHIDNDTGRLVAEIAGGDPLPPTVLEEINCNARLKGAIYDTKGALLWQGLLQAVRHPDPNGRSHRPLRRLLPLQSPPRHVPGPPHRARVTGRAHEHRQYGAHLLGLPPEGPSLRLADPHPRRPAHAAPAESRPLRTLRSPLNNPLSTYPRSMSMRIPQRQAVTRPNKSS